jgi:1-hydroxycarotenoid 3,4-desaturase
MHGVRFRYGAPVREILVENGRAAGVTLQDGERISAGAVVCNADPAAIGAGRFGRSARRATSAIPPRRRSLSAMVWTGRAQTSGFRWFVTTCSSRTITRPSSRRSPPGGLPTRPASMSARKDRDAGAGDITTAANGGERLQIIVNAPASGDGDGFTQTEIETCTQRMVERVSRAGLSLDLAPSTVLTTPAGFESLFPSTGGALYGPASHGWAASFRRQGSRTRIPGLYCAGGSTHPGAGVPMAALSGRLAVECLLRDRDSTSRWRRTAMPGGISTRPARTVPTG